jgi:peptidoglycan/LPS O-acetylase OafA/YrhL
MTDNRLAGADFMRAMACIVVLGHHLAQRMKWGEPVGWMEWLRFFDLTGGFGVSLFFILSGFLLAHPFWQALDRGEPLPSLRIYALRRAARILPGFWLALTVTLVLTVTVFGIPFTGQSLLRYLAGFFLVADWHWITFFPVEINGPLWSIGFEITSYALLPLGFIALFALPDIVRKGSWPLLLWLLFIAAAIGAHLLFMRFVRPDPIGRGWDYGLIGGAKFWMPRFNPFAFFATFAVGALAAGLQVQLAKQRGVIFDLLAAIALAALVAIFVRQTGSRGTEAFGWFSIPHTFPLLQIVAGLFLAFAPSSLALGRLLDNPATRYIARISFGLYVWHYVVLELFRKFLVPDIDHGQMSDPLRLLLFGSAIIVVTGVIAHASFYLMEQPIIRWARGLETRSPAVLKPA